MHTSHVQISPLAFHVKNSLTNSSVGLPTNNFISEIRDYLLRNGYFILRFSASRENGLKIDNIDQTALSFYDQILIASHSECSIVHSSGLENLFALFGTPLILYGSWAPQIYGLNQNAVDIPALLYDKINSELLTLNDTHAFRSDFSYKLQPLPKNISVSMPSSGDVVSVLNDILNLNSNVSIFPCYIYPFKRKLIGRRMLDLFSAPVN